MKILTGILALAFVGCRPASTTPDSPQGTTPHPAQAVNTGKKRTDNHSPRLVLPATGGAPVMATPLGGNAYLPVKGGKPITGTAIGH